MNYEQELKKVMSNVMPFVYRGVICTPIVGGFNVLGKVCKKLEIDDVIDVALGKLGKSITTATQQR